MHQVVTLAGEAIAKNGNLSVRASYWSRQSKHAWTHLANLTLQRICQVNSDATQEGATRFDLTEVEAASPHPFRCGGVQKPHARRPGLGSKPSTSDCMSSWLRHLRVWPCFLHLSCVHPLPSKELRAFCFD